MKKQAFNPYLPSYEYIPDAEPYVFDNRVYIYGSHDRFGGTAFCMNDYVCWSAPVDNLGDWRFEGIIYRKEQDPRCCPDSCMYAPDVAKGPDGRYYLYYTLDFSGTMSVAVADTPAGPYAYYGRVCAPDGHAIGDKDGDVYQYDPGVLADDDGKIWLYTGFGPKLNSPQISKRSDRRQSGCYCIELASDMLTAISSPVCVLPNEGNAPGTSFCDHPFFEAASIRKIGKLYYLVYSSSHLHELCYAVSEYPDRDFRFGGILVSNGDVGIDHWTAERSANYYNNNHGGMVQIGDQWYIFYHRHTNHNSFSRQTCAEKLTVTPDGHIQQAELTSCGLNDGDLLGCGTYPASIACHLFSAKGACNIRYMKPEKEKHPAITQTGADREDNEDSYITNMRDGSTAGYKYFDLRNTTKVEIEVRGDGGTVIVTDGPDGKVYATIAVEPTEEYRTFSAPFAGGKAHSGLYFTVKTPGAMEFRAFTLCE